MSMTTSQKEEMKKAFCEMVYGYDKKILEQLSQPPECIASKECQEKLSRASAFVDRMEKILNSQWGRNN